MRLSRHITLHNHTKNYSNMEMKENRLIIAYTHTQNNQKKNILLTTYSAI